MDTQKEYNFTKLKREIQERSLRLAAKAYLHTAIKSYVELAGEVSIWNPDRFGLSANVVCSLNRAIEHLLKLRLCKTDWFLLFPLPKRGIGGRPLTRDK